MPDVYDDADAPQVMRQMRGAERKDDDEAVQKICAITATRRNV